MEMFPKINVAISLSATHANLLVASVYPTLEPLMGFFVLNLAMVIDMACIFWQLALPCYFIIVVDRGMHV